MSIPAETVAIDRGIAMAIFAGRYWFSILSACPRCGKYRSRTGWSLCACKEDS